jgi:hypothetical protein
MAAPLSKRGVGARASRPLPWKGPPAPQHAARGSTNLDAAELATLRCGEGAQGRRLWLTPQLGRPGERLGSTEVPLGKCAVRHKSMAASTRV